MLLYYLVLHNQQKQMVKKWDLEEIIDIHTQR